MNGSPVAMCPDETTQHIPQTVLEQVHERLRVRTSTNGGDDEGNAVQTPDPRVLSDVFRHVHGGHIL